MTDKKKSTPAPGVTINGQFVTWPFIMKVRRLCGGDWDQTLDCFWKAKDKTGPAAIYKYITEGFIPRNNVRYILLPSRERENGQMESIRMWWSNQIYQPKAGGLGKLNVADELRKLADQIEGKK